MSNQNAPTRRNRAAAVWTGKELIVWGGQGDVALATGARYDPATDRWAVMATLRSPVARYDYTAVWTGQEMVVWGGIDGSGEYLDSGARYNPTTDTWSAMARPQAVSQRALHQAVWTGTQMLIWGGSARPLVAATGGGRYDPATDTWAPSPPRGRRFPPRRRRRSGRAPNCCCSVACVREASRPAARPHSSAPWASTPPARTAGARWPAAVPRKAAAVTWPSGAGARCWSGAACRSSARAGNRRSTGGSYDPAASAWRTISRVQQPSLRHGALAVFATGAGTGAPA